MDTLTRDKPVPEGPFDLAVVGGGINGAAIARDAVMRGHSVALFEKNDLASGASGSSSKMIHGGIRYLEQLRFGLVYQSLRERHLLLRLAPHLVRPQAFVIPIYEGARRGPRWIRAGLWCYDVLCLGRRLGRSRLLSAEEISERAPHLKPEGLVGGGLYWDSVMDDSRLVVANALGAVEEAKARSVPFFLRTYTEVAGIRATTPARLEVHDKLTGRTQQVLAHKVIHAVGPWTDRKLLAPSKGVHLVMPRLPMENGLLLQHAQDGRVFFVIPWRGLAVVGTTETPFEGDPDDVRADPADIEYLLSELRRLFPKISFGPQDVLGVYAGVRPLARSGSWLPFRGDAQLGKVSRRHRIVLQENGVYRVFGGKYTTYRLIAKQVVDSLLGSGGCATHRRPLPGGEEGPWETFELKAPLDELERLGEGQAKRLFGRYGCRSLEILSLCRDDPSLAEPLAEDLPDLRAEVVYAARREFAQYPADFLCRRSDLCFSPGAGRQAYRAVEDLLERHLEAPPPDLEARRRRYFEEREWEDKITGKVPAAT